jgi:uncharacterized protein YyaL (SSP411 family)
MRDGTRPRAVPSTTEESASPSARHRPGGWRLADSSSAYLRGASEQAIDWHPWGEEAFALAARTNRPILLDIGAAWCHWCHVMDEGTYSDPEVARLVNQHFVAVKLDRDERPEIDRRYQRQVNALSGEGGWPLTAFLTPSGDVFLGGTYFPPTDGMGRPGFRRLLKEVSRLWREEPERLRERTTQLRAAIGRLSRAERTETASRSVLVTSVREALAESFDPVNGGFGTAPKFPHPTAVEFLLWNSARSGEEREAAGARETLKRMADGGMYDQIGGGFHRYSVDEGWHVPHFEKMAVDNAALLQAYADAARRFPEEARFPEVIRGTLDWVETTLGDPEGGFGASQDADNAPGDDGGYFTWSRPELKAALDPTETRLVSRVFGVGSEGRMPHDPERNVLFRLMTVEEAAEGSGLTFDEARRTFAQALEKLRAVRARRPAPPVDSARYANVNGALVRGLVAAARALGDERVLARARRVADLFLDRAFDPPRGVAHRLDPAGPSGWGLLDDQAEFALGLADLAGATADPRYVRAAESILSVVKREFSGEDGLLRDVASKLYDGPALGALADAQYPVDDAPHLSSNAAVVLALARLNALAPDPTRRAWAEALSDSLAKKAAHAGLFAAGAAWAAGLLETEPARIVVEGEGPEAERLLRSAERAWHPNSATFRGTPPQPFSLPEELVAASTPGRGAGSSARALVCFGTRCLPPVTEPERLSPLLLEGVRAATPA